MKTIGKIILVLLIFWIFFSIIGYYFRSLTLIGNQVLFSPDNKSLYVTLFYPKREEPQLYQLELNGQIQRRLTFEGMNDLQALSSEGKNVLFIHEKPGVEEAEVRALNLDKYTQETILNLGEHDSMPTFSDDRSKVVFVRATRKYHEHMGFGEAWGIVQLFSYDKKSHKVNQLTTRNENMKPVFLTKNKILFLQQTMDNHQLNMNLFLLDLSTQKQTLIAGPEVYDYVLLRDKKNILYKQAAQDVHRHAVDQLVLINLETKEKKVVYTSSCERDIYGFTISADLGTVVMIQKFGFDRGNRNSKLIALDVRSGKTNSLDIYYYGLKLEDTKRFSFSKWIQELWYY